MKDQVTWFHVISIILASIGAALGIFNTIYLRFKDSVRIKLKVHYAYSFHFGQLSEKPGYSLTVTNLGFMPVTVTEFGFSIPYSDESIKIISDASPNEKKLPHRLESRDALCIYTTPDALEEVKQQYCKTAYVKTACGKIKKVKLPK